MDIVRWKEWVSDAETGIISEVERVAEVKRAAINLAAAEEGELAALVAEKSILVLGMLAVAADSVSITVKSKPGVGDSTALSGPVPLTEAGGFCLPVVADPAAAWFKTAAGEGLTMLLSAAVQVSGNLIYVVA